MKMDEMMWSTGLILHPMVTNNNGTFDIDSHLELLMDSPGGMNYGHNTRDGCGASRRASRANYPRRCGTNMKGDPPDAHLENLAVGKAMTMQFLSSFTRALFGFIFCPIFCCRRQNQLGLG
jgi:hypothetical protein